MFKETEAIIPFDSPKAAQRINVTGWVSRDGYFYHEDERTARFSGCTHVKCSDCNALVPKTRLTCDYCQEKKDNEQYAALPKEEWDGVTPLVLFNTGIYFWSREDVDKYCRQTGARIDSLKLVVCEAVYGPEFDPENFLCDYLPDGNDVPEEIKEASKLLNQAIANAGVLSWHQGNVAAVLTWKTNASQRTDQTTKTLSNSSSHPADKRRQVNSLQRPFHPLSFVRL